MPQARYAPYRTTAVQGVAVQDNTVRGTAGRTGQTTLQGTYNTAEHLGAQVYGATVRYGAQRAHGIVVQGIAVEGITVRDTAGL